MRIAILLAMSALSAVTVLAQQTTNACQAEEKAVERYKILQQDKVIPPEQLLVVQEAYARCQKQQAQLALLKATENATQARLEDLRKRFTDNYPDVKALKARLAELQAQDAGLRGQKLLKASGGLQTGLPDRWWKNAATAQSLGLTADQQKKMDDVFQQYRLKLIDLNAALEKEEITLEPLVAAESLDESKVTSQIDRVAQARAELEKANGRMLLGIRKQLTPEQWTKLNQ